MTPWKSWITCEETLVGTASGFPKPHGYAYDVPAMASGPVPAVPLPQLGRFAHEAIAVDPRTGIPYETEDAGGTSGLYRFVPRASGKLAEGTLQMLAIARNPQFDASTGQIVGASLPVEWVSVDIPDPGPADPTPFAQGFARGGTAFRRLEGMWYSAADRAIYFNSTDGGDAAAGQVWCLQISRKGDAPNGSILLCEDRDRARQAFLRGLTPDGVLYDFAANIRPGVIPGSTTPAAFDEFAGATFSKDGEWLVVNIHAGGEPSSPTAER